MGICRRSCRRNGTRYNVDLILLINNSYIHFKGGCMNYLKHYELLIDRAKSRSKLSEYIEKHHVIPKCLGGNDDIINIVELTPEEHYFAHQLLAKIYADNCGLISACKLMSGNISGKRSNNKSYGWIRRKSNILMGKSIRQFHDDKRNKESKSLGFENYIELSKSIWDLFINHNLHYTSIEEKFKVSRHFVKRSLEVYAKNNDLMTELSQGYYDLKSRSQKEGRSKFTEDQESNRVNAVKNIDYAARSLKTGSRKGSLNPTFGKTWTHIKMTCPHCNKEVSGKRWHFDNCRSKNENQIDKI